MKVAIVGYGVVGQAYSQLFTDAIIYDPFSDKTVDANDMAKLFNMIVELNDEHIKND